MNLPLRVLQVEDSESDAELIVRHLRNAGYEVHSLRVQDANAMRAALAAHAWELVICDYRMPSFDAPAALAILQESALDIPFLVVSGTMGEEVAVSMMRAGAHDYLMKDNLRRLSSAVERELREAKTRAERREVLQVLAGREAHLSLVIESTEMGVFDYDPATGRATYSDHACKHLRVPPGSNLTPEEFLEGVHSEDRETVRQALYAAFDPAGAGRFAIDYRLNDDPRFGEIWISASGRALRDETGEMVRFLGVIQDVTERKKSERELQFQLQLTACIAEQSSDSIMLSDMDGTMRFVNPEAERTFGFTFEEFRGASGHDLLHHHYPDGRPFPAAECDMVPQQAVPLRDKEYVFFHKDGTPIDVSVSSVPLAIAGKRAGNVVTARDIRERKRAERALRESDARFRRLFEADIVGIMIADDEFITEANDGLLAMLGYTRAEFGAQPMAWRGIVAPPHRAECERMMASIVATGVCPAFEKEYLKKDGTTLPALFAGVALNPGVDSRVLGFVVDLTERKNLESQVRQAQKLESVGLLAGGVAHDFNNLLTVILGYTDLVRGEMGPTHPLSAPMEQIAGAANRAAGLTRQLLTFSRRNAGEPRNVHLNELVKGVENMLRRLIGEHIEVVFSTDSGPHLIFADPGLVEQVVFNLAVNARDAMPEGGTLYIETSRLVITEGFVSPSLTAGPGTYVSLAVTDTGMGMTPEVQERLFEPFFTTKEPGKGTGLGLSTVYGIVRQSGGAITVHSTPGIGTAIRVLFPAASPDNSAGPASASPQSVEGTETILLVEDESGVRNYVRHILLSHGYHALDAASGEDAVEMAKLYKGTIHLLLTDVVLPGMKGSEVVERFLASRPGVPVLRMSGYPERFGEHLGSAQPHLQKPFTAETLLARIRELLDRK